MLKATTAIAAVLFAASMATAHARTVDLYKSGSWTAYKSHVQPDNKPACGMTTSGQMRDGNALLDIKTWDEGLYFLIIEQSGNSRAMVSTFR